MLATAKQGWERADTVERSVGAKRSPQDVGGVGCGGGDPHTVVTYTLPPLRLSYLLSCFPHGYKFVSLVHCSARTRSREAPNRLPIDQSKEAATRPDDYDNFSD